MSEQLTIKIKTVSEFVSNHKSKSAEILRAETWNKVIDTYTIHSRLNYS